MNFGIGWIAVFILVALLNLYLIYHFFLIPFKSRKALKRGVLVIIYLLFMMSAFLYFSYFFNGNTQTPLTDKLMYMAGIYLCMLFYSIGFFFIYDVLRLINLLKKFPEKLRFWAGRFFYGGLTIFIISALITASGFYPATNFVTNHFEVTTEKKTSHLEDIKITAISDAHIGVNIKRSEIDEIKDKIMDSKPDMIALVGDMFDEGTTDSLKEYTSHVFSELEAPLGVYYVLGNHDDYTGHTEKEVQYFKDAGITVLLDQVHEVDDAFYVIGREDNHDRRTAYSNLEAKITKDLPVIVLDHKPSYEEVSISNKADVQLSGHTHNGQVFPIQTVDLFNFSLNYGLHQRGNTQILVSSGVGCYGIPIRIGSPCEIVDLNIHFE